MQATEVGGTHPALIEAMGYGNCVLAYGTPENREVLGDGGIIYESVEDLRARSCRPWPMTRTPACPTASAP